MGRKKQIRSKVRKEYWKVRQADKRIMTEERKDGEKEGMRGND